jgi:hypothetical protein
MLKIVTMAIPIAKTFEVSLAVDTKILDVAMISAQPFLNLLTNPLDTTMVTKRFVIVRSGEVTEWSMSKLSFIGSFSFRNDTLYYHVFELLK